MRRSAAFRTGISVLVGAAALAACAGPALGPVPSPGPSGGNEAGFAALLTQMRAVESEGCRRLGYRKGGVRHDLCLRRRMAARSTALRAALAAERAAARARRAAALACAGPRPPFARRCLRI